MLNVWTAQYRYPGADRLDITVKGKDTIGRFFAPTWDMVRKFKDNVVTYPDLLAQQKEQIAELDRLMREGKLLPPEVTTKTQQIWVEMAKQEYLRDYHTLITKLYVERRDVFDMLLNKEQIVLVCFCPYTNFCHRVALAEYLVQLGATYHGEITDFGDLGKKPEVIDSFKGEYQWLSNFAHVEFTHGGQKYLSVEHFYQAQKAGPNDMITIVHPTNENQTIQVNAREYIATCNNPKKTVRKYNIQLPEDWKKGKNIKVMRTGLEYKFLANKRYRKLLSDTGEAVIREGNTWHDNFWGDCKCHSDPTARWVKEGCEVPGKDILGQMIMELRGLI